MTQNEIYRGQDENGVWHVGFIYSAYAGCPFGNGTEHFNVEEGTLELVGFVRKGKARRNFTAAELDKILSGEEIYPIDLSVDHAD